MRSGPRLGERQHSAVPPMTFVVHPLLTIDHSKVERPHGERWYVVHCHPHAEARAEQHLAQQGYVVFCPRLRRLVRHARQSSVKFVPLFPRYLFVQLDTGRQRWRAINGTAGVARLLVQGDEPAAAPLGVVESLMARVIDQDSLKIGAPVQIAEGPFAGLMGTLEHLDERGRVRVLLDLLGRRVSVMVGGRVVSSAA
jgi:transcription elongation factor/antiterminator RfaH